MNFRIKCTSRNTSPPVVAYLYQLPNGAWNCALADGTPCAATFAGIDMADVKALDRALACATSPNVALSVVLGFAKRYQLGPRKDDFMYHYELEEEPTNVLVDYFRKEGFEPFGHRGDYEGWSPEQTAVFFLTEYKSYIEILKEGGAGCVDDNCPYYGTQHAHVEDALGRKMVLGSDDADPEHEHDDDQAPKADTVVRHEFRSDTLGGYKIRPDGEQPSPKEQSEMIQLDELDLPTQDTGDYARLFDTMLEICKDLVVVARFEETGLPEKAEALVEDIGLRVGQMFADLQPQPERDWYGEWKLAVKEERTVLSFNHWRDTRQYNEMERAMEHPDPLDVELWRDHVMNGLTLNAYGTWCEDQRRQQGRI